MKQNGTLHFISGKLATPMVSNTHDLVLWVCALFNGKVIPKQQLNQMMNVVCVGDDKTCRPGEPLTKDSRSDGYGLGIASFYDSALGGVCWTYVGGTPGYYSAFLWVPKKKLALALTVSATTKKSQNLLYVLIAAAKQVI